MRTIRVYLVLSVCTGVVFSADLHATCKAYGKFFIKTTRLTQSAGDRIEVFENKSGKKTCPKDLKNPHYVWDRGEDSINDLFSALQGDFLLLSSGTDEFSSQTHLIDLKKKEEILTLPSDTSLEKDHVRVRELLKETRIDSSTPANCESRIRTKLEAWAKANKLSVKLGSCDCAKWIQETGSAAAMVSYKIDYKDLSHSYLPSATCAYLP